MIFASRLFVSLLYIYILCIVRCQSTLTINTEPFTNINLQTGQYYFKDLFEKTAEKTQVDQALIVRHIGDDVDTVFEPITALIADSSMEDLNGRIVFQTFLGSRDFLAAMRRIQEAGAVAILFGTDSVVSGQYGCAYTAAEPSGQVTIPILEISEPNFAEIRNAVLNGTVIEATLSSEGNPWNLLGGVAVVIVFRVIYTTVSAGLIGYALYKLIMFIRHQGHQFNVPQVCLALEIIANLLDPFGCFGNYGIATNFLTTISFPFEVATFVLITFYWFEAVTNASLTIYPFIEKFRPFFFAFTIIFIAVIISVSLLGYFLAFSITTPLIIIYLIVCLAFLIFYIVTVVKIAKKLAKSNNLRGKRKTKVLTQTNQKIILNGVIRVISLVPIMTYISPDIATAPMPQLVASVFIYGLILLDSWARIFLFSEPSGKTSTTSLKRSESGTSASPRTKAELASSKIEDIDVQV